MSDDAPGVEYLGPEPAPRNPRRRKRGLVAAAVAGVLVAGGAGAWGVGQFLGGGEAPATVVPGDALAYLSVDLDPSAEQKLEALRALRAFPALEELGGKAGDDLRRWLFEALVADAPCDDLDFDTDLGPWLGDRLAVAVLPGTDEPVAVGVVQVKDEQEALAGLRGISECADEKAPGAAFAGDYMVVAETDAIAEDVVADAGQRSLADDDQFRRWVDEAGGSGIVTGYVAASAPEVLVDQLGAADGLAPGFDAAALGAMLADFEGAAAVLRFDDGALEVESAAGGLDALVEPGDGDSGLGDLPGSTAVALGLGVPDDAVSDLMELIAGSTSQAELERAVKQLESETGLTLPEDLQTLLGDGFSVALDSSVDLGSLIGGDGGAPLGLPLGVRIAGDPERITPVLDKLLTATGAQGMLTVETGDGVVAVGLRPDYVAELARDGDLADADAFGRALPGYDSRDAAAYVDFDVDDWLSGLLAADPGLHEVRENVEPLTTLGATSHRADGVVHGLLRLGIE